MINIRKAKMEDIAETQDICYVTANDLARPQNRVWLFALYNDYYIRYQTDNCFVAVDDKDKAVGYILCCIDFNDYCRKMKKIFLPIVRRSNFKQYLLARIEMSLNKKQVRQGYTAHMHIDILPEYQRIGVGRRLVDELVKHLQAIGVSRLTLTCSVSNTKGVNFYRQYGFKDIGKLPGAIIFGLDIVNKNLE